MQLYSAVQLSNFIFSHNAIMVYISFITVAKVFKFGFTVWHEELFVTPPKDVLRVATNLSGALVY